MSKILLLGGTSDGRKLAARLHKAGFQVIYSVAGLVRMPELDCEVISGGFSQFAQEQVSIKEERNPSVSGLISFLKTQQVALILDVTHPYAVNMSTHAVQAAEAVQIPCWRFHRPVWEMQEGDRWSSFSDWHEMLQQLRFRQGGVLLTKGQLTQSELDQLMDVVNQSAVKTTEISHGKVSQGSLDKSGSETLRIVMRTAAPSRVELPEEIHWIKAIGPFDAGNEKALLEEHRIQVIVSKNSGGKATQGKLEAARALGIEVFMLQRPELPKATRSFSDPDQVFAELIARGIHV